MKRLPVTIAELEYGQCRWVHGDPSHLDTHRYCGRETVPTTSWCIRHLRKVTPTAQTIINRELEKFERGDQPIVARFPRKMTEAETTARDEYQPDIIEEMEKRR